MNTSLDTDQQSMIDAMYMARCFELASAARAAGNSAVGAVLAIGAELLVEAGEQAPRGPDPFAHAELLVIRQAATKVGRDRLSAATLYTSKEPCFLCSYAIRWARLSRVVYAEPVDAIGGITSAYPICTAEGIAGWGPPPAVARLSSGAAG